MQVTGQITQNVTDTIVREDWNMRQVLIDGFTQDSLAYQSGLWIHRCACE